MRFDQTSGSSKGPGKGYARFRRHRAFAAFLGYCGVDIDQVVNSSGSLQEMLLGFHKAQKQVDRMRAETAVASER